MADFEQLLTYDLLIRFVPAIIMALYCTRNMDTHSVRGMWEFLRVYDFFRVLYRDCTADAGMRGRER